jgi:hypothetical protein
MRKGKREIIRSNKLLYLSTKYGFFVLGLGLVLKNYQYFITVHFENKSLIVISILLAIIGFLLLNVVKPAVLNINEIQIGKKSFIKWSDLKSINRVGYYYVGITKRRFGVIIFPLDEFGSWLWHYSDSSMVQLIDIVKGKYNI